MELILPPKFPETTEPLQIDAALGRRARWVDNDELHFFPQRPAPCEKILVAVAPHPGGAHRQESPIALMPQGTAAKS